ncbi:uncharacterized protein PRCAT00004902001 [Priceomyces carsonii]|uniref:uncharacterized protein n=1 Tax=Priceomyces carsonii TaxID=28549 RepID=UPI002EDA71C4|nr:unnamed protein product [Priceomyces carsonii]
MAPPVIRESDDEDGYSERETSSVRLGNGRAARKANNVSKKKADHSDELSDMTDREEEVDDEEDEDEEEDEERDRTSDLEDARDDTPLKSQPDEDEDDEDDDEDEEEDDEEDEEDEEEEEDVPSVSDEEDNYKLEDPDEIDEDLELKEDEDEEYEDEEQRSSSKRVAAVRGTNKEKTVATKLAPTASRRETRKRQLPTYRDEDTESDSPRGRPGRKAHRVLEAQQGPLDLDEDLILTDEELEYNPQANPDPSKMTERQRSRFLEDIGQGDELQSLEKVSQSMKKGRPKKTETEEQVALRKAENARRRHDHKLKQLEEEKRDTLNKLLKRRASKTRELDSKEGSVDISKHPLKPRRPEIEHPALFRYVNNTTNLKGNSVLAFYSK